MYIVRFVSKKFSEVLHIWQICARLNELRIASCISVKIGLSDHNRITVERTTGVRDIGEKIQTSENSVAFCHAKPSSARRKWVFVLLNWRVCVCIWHRTVERQKIIVRHVARRRRLFHMLHTCSLHEHGKMVSSVWKWKSVERPAWNTMAREWKMLKTANSLLIGNVLHHCSGSAFLLSKFIHIKIWFLQT